ncbi:hypothetical protein NDU88_006618 [Pleurodeles waltl]|uniref:Uncharacterized protein n=1 Tax=Pleurodeles waltl TaxID=8319 RepID=A0AAV7LR73_PLEWA|nr:hypothetical protein NDU88_006618 [Pleurodeles waltl]
MLRRRGTHRTGRGWGRRSCTALWLCSDDSSGTWHEHRKYSGRWAWPGCRARWPALSEALPGRSSSLLLLLAVLAGADSGGTPGESRRHLGCGGAAIWAGVVA